MLTRKNIIWMIVLMITAWLTWQTYQQEAEMSVVEPVARIAVRAEGYRGPGIDNANAKPTTGSFELTMRVKETQPYFNLFAHAKKIEKPILNIATPVLAPAAPTLPFKYLGKVTEKDQVKVILDYRGEVLAAKVGDVLGANYQLVSINKIANSTEFLFLFLPMNITQTMVVEDVSKH